MDLSIEEIEAAWKRFNQPYISPSRLTSSVSSWLFKYGFLSSEERQDLLVGYNAHFGSATHNGIQNIITAGADIADEIKQQQINLAFQNVPEPDDVTLAKYKDDLPNAINNGVQTLAEAGFIGGLPEEKISTRIPDIHIDVIGYVDLVVPDTMFCEMKTKAARKTKVLKSGGQGWAKATLPKKPDHAHLIQTSIYYHALKTTPSICYISADDAVLFTPFNCDELKHDAMMHYLDEARQRALLRQNLVCLSDDVKFLASITDPDWQHNYQWKLQPEYLRKAKQLWEM